MPKKGERVSEETKKKMRITALGRKRTIEAREKLSTTRKRLFLEGKLTPWNKGKHGIYSPETKQKISAGAKRAWQNVNNEKKLKLSEIRRLTFKRMWANEEFYIKMRTVLLKNNEKIISDPAIREKRSIAHKKLWRNPDYINRVKRGLKIKPNDEELYLDAILQMNFKNQWKYTGDFQFWIEGKNPDFVNVNGIKLLIEFNGHPFNHTTERDRAKTAHYAKYGWGTLNLTYNDLKDETMLVSKLAAFTNTELHKRAT